MVLDENVEWFWVGLGFCDRVSVCEELKLDLFEKVELFLTMAIWF